MALVDWAFIISLASFVISVFSLGWNIWSKWIYPKPKVKVSFSEFTFIWQSGESPPFLQVAAVNFGPTETTLKCLIARSRSPAWWRKLGNRRWKQMVLIHTSTADEAISEIVEGCGGLPHKLTVGDEFRTFLIFKHQHLRDDGIIDLGFVDVFGRLHWAPRNEVRRVVRSIRKEWPRGHS